MRRNADDIVQILSDFRKMRMRNISQSDICLIDAISTLITTGLKKTMMLVDDAFHFLKVFTRQL